MTEAPKRIWAAQNKYSGATMWWPDSMATGTEYTRSDHVNELIAAAREEALREAAEKCHAFMLSLSNDIPPVEHTDIDTCIILRSRILALIPTAEGEAD